MPKQKISEFNSNPALNTDIDSINISEGCAPSGINDAIRELMAQLKDWQSGTSNDPYVVGSSGSLTLNQGTANGVAYLNGSKVVTSGSALTFDGTTLSAARYLSTSSSASLPSYAVESGSGIFNAGASTIGFSVGSSEAMRLTSTGLGIGTSSPAAKLQVTSSSRDVAIIESTDAGALNGPYLNLFRNSASPAANDYLGFLEFSGKNSSGSSVDYAFIGVQAIQVTTSPAQKGDLVFYTANEASPSEVMRLNSSGNLGLGVTPSAWNSNYKGFQMNGGALQAYTSGDRFAVNQNAFVNSGGVSAYVNNGYASQYLQLNSEHRFYTAPSGTAGNAITFTQAMTLDASGKLGVGTTTPDSYSWGAGIGINGSSYSAFTLKVGDSGKGYVAAGSSAMYIGGTNPLLFFTGGTGSGNEVMRLDSSGNLLVGTTSGSTNIFLRSGDTSNPVFITRNGNTSGNTFGANINFSGSAPNNTTSFFLQCNDTGAERATIRSNGGLANFSANNVNLSDERTKTNIQNAGSYLAKICAIPVRTFKYKDQTDDLLNLGVIAQEVEIIAPELVDVTGFGETPEDGVPLKAIYQTDLQYALMKALQELKAEFDAYKASHP